VADSWHPNMNRTNTINIDIAEMSVLVFITIPPIFVGIAADRENYDSKSKDSIPLIKDAHRFTDGIGFIS